jgi:hypothetical protein
MTWWQVILICFGCMGYAAVGIVTGKLAGFTYDGLLWVDCLCGIFWPVVWLVFWLFELWEWLDPRSYSVWPAMKAAWRAGRKFQKYFATTKKVSK